PPWHRVPHPIIPGSRDAPRSHRPGACPQAMHLNEGWANGGTTELDATAPGCKRHHDLRDIVGWHVDLDPDTATTTWTRRVPAGSREHRSPDRRTVLVTHPPDP
ncbi:MAG: hypothetical protein KY437_04900, partial [Actinobacteria bacterium]|nr:hypothetical protein [Actinomycetota bacterium]